MYCTTKIQNSTVVLFDLVALDDLDSIQGHKRLRKVLRSIKSTICVVPSALFKSHATVLPGEASNDRKSKV